jgi:hypothetical protein
LKVLSPQNSRSANGQTSMPSAEAISRDAPESDAPESAPSHVSLALEPCRKAQQLEPRVALVNTRPSDEGVGSRVPYTLAPDSPPGFCPAPPRSAPLVRRDTLETPPGSSAADRVHCGKLNRPGITFCTSCGLTQHPTSNSSSPRHPAASSRDDVPLEQLGAEAQADRHCLSYSSPSSSPMYVARSVMLHSPPRCTVDYPTALGSATSCLLLHDC